MTNSRKENYIIDEDRHMCHTYIEISQDPKIGINQSKTQFWNRVADAYNSTRPNPSMPERSSRSIDMRMDNILAAISTFKGCVEQVEYNKPSGASEVDIMNHAKELMRIKEKYSKGFKYEHVWDIMKNFEKYNCKTQKPRAEKFSAGQSYTTVSQSPPSLDSLSSFSINLSDDSGSGSGEDASVVMSSLNEHNNELFDSSAKSRERDREIQLQKIEAQQKATEARNRLADEYRWEADNKILIINTESISNPTRRLYFEQEQARILSKRQKQLSQSIPPNNNPFEYGSYFPDLGGSGLEMA